MTNDYTTIIHKRNTNKKFVPFKAGGDLVNVIRPKLFKHALTLGRDLTLVETRDFLLNHRKSISRATLFTEWLKVCKYRARVNAVKNQKTLPELPTELVLIIFEQCGSQY